MNANIFHPAYDNSILGTPNSILAHYGAKPHHATLPVLDDRLRHGYKNVVLWVLDSMGWVFDEKLRCAAEFRLSVTASARKRTSCCSISSSSSLPRI